MTFTPQRFDLSLHGSGDGPHHLNGLSWTGPVLHLPAAAIRAGFETVAAALSDARALESYSVFLNDRPAAAGWISALFRDLQTAEAALKAGIDQPDTAEHWGNPGLNAVSRYLPENSAQLYERLHWFQIGSFETTGLWRVDKGQIKAILWQESLDLHLFLCPSFDFARTEQIIDRLPDILDTTAGNWHVLEQTVAEGTRVKRRAVGVVHKLTRLGSTETPAGTGGTGASSEARRRFIPDVRFDDIGGIDSILGTIREVIELPLKRPEVFQRLGIRPHRGILLYGPPGCGKTMIAKAIANEIQAHFIPVKGPEILEKYYGASEENLRALFEEARELQPAVIFFDEMDAVAGRRTGLDVLRMDDRLVNQLLALMDGIEAYGSVCVIGATNRPELIDGALTRPGRFDYRLEVPRPDVNGIRQILSIATRTMPLDPAAAAGDWASRLEGRSGADVAFLAREAAYACIRRHLNGTSRAGDWEALDPESMTIGNEDFEAALTRLQGS